MNAAPEIGRRPWRESTGAWCLFLAFLSLVATAPGLSGSWVHDDINMQGNPQYSGFDDVLAVFGRHSGDYAKTSAKAIDSAASRTYRPVAMLTLVATQAFSPTPWLHHIFGWILHWMTAALFFCALRRSDPRVTSRRAHRFVAALFFLHPVGVETYVWINGRSDLVAGLWLAALLLVLSSDAPVRPRMAASVFGITLLGSASKETFAPAALLAAIALLLVRGGREGAGKPLSRAAAWQGALATVLGIAGYVLARGWVLPNRSSSLGQAGSPFATATGWLFIPKLVAIASYALLSLRAAAMQSLGWDVVRALSFGEWLCGSAALLAFGALLRRRDWRGAVLTLAAAACAAPVIVVVFVIWLGLDRYLYMPLLLLLFAASPYVVEAEALVRDKTPRLLPLVVAGVLAVAAANTFLASRAYHSQATWLATLADERPDDPTTLLFLAPELNPSAMKLLLQRFPPPPWPSSAVVPLIALSLASGQTSLARQAAEYGVAHFPENRMIVAHALRLRYLAGKKVQALAMLSALAGELALCEEVRSQLRIWATQSAGIDRERLIVAIAGMRCQASR